MPLVSHSHATAIPTPQAEGLLFVEFLGSTTLDDIDGEKSFELEDFTNRILRIMSATLAIVYREKVDLPGEFGIHLRRNRTMYAANGMLTASMLRIMTWLGDMVS